MLRAGLRGLGWICCLAAVATLGLDLWRLIDGQGFALSSLADALAVLGAAPTLEELPTWLGNSLTWLPAAPAIAVLGLIGLLLLWLGRRRKRQRRFFY